MSRHPTLKGLVPQSAAFGHGTAGGTMSKNFLRGGVQNITMPLWTHYAGSKVFYRPPAGLSREEFLEIEEIECDFAPASTLMLLTSKSAAARAKGDLEPGATFVAELSGKTG